MNAMTRTAKHDYFIFKSELRDKAIDQGDMTDVRLKGLYQRYVMGTAPDWVMAIMDATPAVKKVNVDTTQKFGVGEHKAAVDRGVWTFNLILELLSEKPLDVDELRSMAIARGAKLETVKAQTSRLVGLKKIKDTIYSDFSDKLSGCGRVYSLPEHADTAKKMAHQKTVCSAKEKYKDVLSLLSYRPISALEISEIIGKPSENTRSRMKRLVALGLAKQVPIMIESGGQNRRSYGYIVGGAA